MDYKDLQDKDRKNEFDSSAHEHPNALAFYSENGLAANIQTKANVARTGDKSQEMTSYQSNSNLARSGGAVNFPKRLKREI